MKNLQKSNNSVGNVYVMTHSFFSDVIRIGCTTENPEQYTKLLSDKTPGSYTLVYSQQCKNPCLVKKRIQEYLNAQKFVEEFYQVPANVAEKLLKREILVIPSLNTI